MLRARDVWDEQEERRANRMAAMGPIIAQIQAQIRKQATHNSNAPYIVYPVPTYVFGYPLFSLREAVEHLVAEFSRAGYWVWVVENNTTLVISWMKPVKTRDGSKPILATNYRPMPYSDTFMPGSR
jgi:hypothetical protein